MQFGNGKSTVLTSGEKQSLNRLQKKSAEVKKNAGNVQQDIKTQS
jgi:hypothetical protein